MGAGGVLVVGEGPELADSFDPPCGCFLGMVALPPMQMADTEAFQKAILNQGHLLGQHQHELLNL